LKTPQIRVVAGALFDRQGAVLIAQRPEGKHLAGAWEFPGGKIAAGESDERALTRELREELGVEVVSSRAFMTLAHDYGDRCIELRLRLVERWRGAPQGLDGQALRWVPLALLGEADILEADRPFIGALQDAAAAGRLPAGQEKGES
jgi:8-oxo-dGTP diphosphatase